MPWSLLECVMCAVRGRRRGGPLADDARAGSTVDCAASSLSTVDCAV